MVSTVHLGSPAEKAGLQKYDVIIRFGDAEIRDFTNLNALISRRQVGEEVEVEMLRRGFEDGNPAASRIVAKVVLAPWELEAAIQNGPRP